MLQGSEVGLFVLNTTHTHNIHAHTQFRKRARVNDRFLGGRNAIYYGLKLVSVDMAENSTE